MFILNDKTFIQSDKCNNRYPICCPLYKMAFGLEQYFTTAPLRKSVLWLRCMYSVGSCICESSEVEDISLLLV